MTGKNRSWLIDARKRANLTQEELAERIGISRTAYVRYESGDRNPTPTTASKLENILGVDKTKFFWD